jgi:cytochrome c
MIKRPKHIYLDIFIALFLYALINFNGTSAKRPQQENHPPTVKIIAPKNNSVFDWDAPVSYQIGVSDKEDGDSRFDEINTKEVLLEVRHISNKAKLPSDLNKTVQPDPPGLAIMRTSNCFNCHNFNSKSIGPSFYEINKRYPTTKPNIDTLVKRIRQGSSGIWGKEKMPTHPELTAEETKVTVQWILKHAADADVNYYIGIAGVFRIKAPVAANQKGVYVLTASYVDHGLKNVPGKRLKGEDVVVIYGK